MAINLCRAERKTGHTFKSATADTVAPGSYNVPTDAIKVEGERPVPFASGVDKVCCPNLGTSGYTPGPGHYVGQIETRDDPNSRGPVTFKSKSARIGPTTPGSTIFTESSLYKNPGPGTYGTREEWELALKKPSRNAANPWREAPEKTVPSIPMQKLPPDAQPQSTMGGDISNMVMRHTGERKDMAGPGEYDPKISLTVAAQPQTSFAAAGGKKERPLFDSNVSIVQRGIPPRENPGPGSYDVKHIIGAENGEGEKSGTYQFASKTSLSHQKNQPDGKAAPGPGQYDPPNYFEKQILKARAHATTHGDRTCFGSKGERTGWTRPPDMPFVDPYHIHNVPGPGSYPTVGGIFPAPGKDKEKEAAKAMPGGKKKRFHGVHHPMIVMALQETEGPLEAFGSTDDRECNKVRSQSTPAPWAYNKDEARGASMAAELREKKKIGRNGAFGSLADRFYGSPLSGRDDLPDPGMGDTEGASSPSGANAEPRSMFVSQTPRQAPSNGEVQAVMVGQQETPAPGAYYVENEVNYRSPFRHPRTDHLSFGSGKSRFDIGRDLFDGHAPGLENPAPGAYDYRMPVSARQGAAESRDKRRMVPPIGSTTVDVGPGSYGSIETTMLKKTFNVSTQAPANLPRSTPRRG